MSQHGETSQGGSEQLHGAPAVADSGKSSVPGKGRALKDSAGAGAGVKWMLDGGRPGSKRTAARAANFADMPRGSAARKRRRDEQQ